MRHNAFSRTARTVIGHLHSTKYIQSPKKCLSSRIRYDFNKLSTCCGWNDIFHLSAQVFLKSLDDCVKKYWGLSDLFIFRTFVLRLFNFFFVSFFLINLKNDHLRSARRNDLFLFTSVINATYVAFFILFTQSFKINLCFKPFTNQNHQRILSEWKYLSLIYIIACFKCIACFYSLHKQHKICHIFILYCKIYFISPDFFLHHVLLYLLVKSLLFFRQECIWNYRVWSLNNRLP